MDFERWIMHQSSTKLRQFSSVYSRTRKLTLLLGSSASVTWISAGSRSLSAPTATEAAKRRVLEEDTSGSRGQLFPERNESLCEKLRTVPLTRTEEQLGREIGHLAREEKETRCGVVELIHSSIDDLSKSSSEMLLLQYIEKAACFGLCWTVGDEVDKTEIIRGRQMGADTVRFDMIG